MLKNSKILLIGIGNKARNGKDSFASFASKFVSEFYNKGNLYTKYLFKSFILRFSDELYEECQNMGSYDDSPLIKVRNDMNNNNNLVFYLKDRNKYKEYDYDYLKNNRHFLYFKVSSLYNGGGESDKRKELYEKLCDWWNEVGKYKSVFIGESLYYYYKMEEKDPILLQLWGTHFRRKFFGEDYWVKKLENKVNELDSLMNEYMVTDNNSFIVFIPDTRFKNEYEWIKSNGGLYIKVIRLREEDGKQYIDTSRDPNHQSEIELDSVVGDYEISCYNLEQLKNETENIMKKILKDFLQKTGPIKEKSVLY